PQAHRPTHDFLDGISDRTAVILCYIPVFGIIPAIVFLASQRFCGNSRVRFNAFQSLYLFVAWLIVSSALPAFLFAGAAPWWPAVAVTGLVKLAFFICWIYLLIKAANQQEVRLPIIGDLAARSIAEQM
ncbi:MAG: DUF4870 domain-containing protein, partial [Bryobacteraceae bacterium]